MSDDTSPSNETLGGTAERNFVVSRRGVLAGGAGLGLATVLAACGADGVSSTSVFSRMTVRVG